MDKKKILIPGGQFSDWALVNAAHRLGLYVITSGYRETDPAHLFSDKYIPADYSDKEAMLKIAKDEHIDYMCSNANDFGLLSTAYVCEQLGLPGHDSYKTTQFLHSKDSFKAMAKKLGLHSPSSEIFDNEEDAVAYLKTTNKRMILKPTDNVGSNGVIDTNVSSDYRELVDYAFSKSKAHKIVIEEYIEGFFAPATSMIINQKVVAFFCDGFFEYKEGERTKKDYPISEKSTGLMQPCPYMEEFQDYIIDDFNKIAKELKLVDGKFHCELMITPDHKAYIFDVHRRMSGFWYPWTEWDHTTGLNWCDWIVKSECGMDISDFPVGIKQSKYFYRRNIYAPKNGHITTVRFDEYLTSHMVPKREEKNYVLHDLVVTDHLRQPVVDVCESFFKTGLRTGEGPVNFQFDTIAECEYLANPKNSDEFYKHITFEYDMC